MAYSDNKSRPNNCIAEILVNGVPLKMVVDTSAVVSVLPDFVYFDKFLEPTPKLKRSKMSLETCTGKNINVLGELQVRVNTKDGQQKFIPIVLIQSESRNQPVIMGSNWLEAIKLDCNEVTRDAGHDSTHFEQKGRAVLNTTSPNVEDLKRKYSNVSDVAFGEIQNVDGELVLKDNATLVFCKQHSAPLKICDSRTIATYFHTTSHV